MIKPYQYISQFLMLLLALLPAASVAQEKPTLGQESEKNQEQEQANKSNAESKTDEQPHVLLHTTLGNIRIKLHHATAPEHSKVFASWCQAKIYDSTPFHLIKHDRYLETGRHQSRPHPLTSLQKSLIKEMPIEKGDAELSRGGLYLIPPDKAKDDDSTTFSIYMGQERIKVSVFTVFGQVVEGMDTLARIEDVAINRMGFPLRPTVIIQARLIDADHKTIYDPAYHQLIEERYTKMADPMRLAQNKQDNQKKKVASPAEDDAVRKSISLMAALLFFFGLGVWYLSTRKDPISMASFGGLAMLTGSFAVFSALYDQAAKTPKLGMVLLFGSLISFYWLSRIERRE